MDYKTKYLKYKLKYFDLKNEIEGGAIIVGAIATPFVAAAGIAKGTQLLGRNIKQMFKSKDTTQKEIEKIAEIVEKLKNHKSYPKNKIKKSTNKYAIFVDEFLAFVKDLKKNYNADISKLGVTPEDLDFLLSKHYMCKKSQMSLFYEVSECKLTKKTSSSTKSDKTSSSSTKSDKTTSPAKTASPPAKTTSPAKTASPPAKTATKKK